MARSPAWWPLLGFAAGIALEAAPGGPDLPWLAISAAILPVAALLMAARTAAQAVTPLLLMSLVALGAARHEQDRTLYEQTLLYRQLDEHTPRLVKFRGWVEDAPKVYVNDDPTRPVWASDTTSSLLIRCQWVAGAEGWHAAGGTIRVLTDGRIARVSAGDAVEVIGLGRRPQSSSNPGEFDFAAFARRQNVVATVRCAREEAIQPLGRAAGIWPAWKRLRADVRQRLAEPLEQHLSASTRGVAQALTLGSREALDETLTDTWMRAGTMHVLAISGLHVGIFAMVAGIVLHLVGFRRRTYVIAVGTLVLMFALLVESRPSVMRATVLAELALAAELLGRPRNLFNALCITGWGLLVWSPADLFDPGAQLSFLAAGVICANAAAQREPVDDGEIPLQPWWHPQRYWRSRLVRRTKDGLWIAILVWFWSAPLVAANFQLISWVGAILSPIFILLTTACLILAYGSLAISFVFPSVGAGGFVCLDWLLQLTDTVAQAVAAWPGTWTRVPRIPGLWLAGWFLLFAIWLRRRPSGEQQQEGERLARWRFDRFAGAVTAWLVIGVVLITWPNSSQRLTVQFLDVGHGTAVLIQLPDGRMLLYDAGSISGGYAAARTIEQALWSAGGRQIDALILSHADFDHYSAVPHLLEDVPVRTLAVASQFLASRQPSAVSVRETIAQHGVPLRQLAAGDTVPFSPGGVIEVRHPSAGSRWPNDNAASLVLEIRYAGREILLTGDLEAEGLAAVLRQESPEVDVLMAPHHGGRSSNVPELAEWSFPQVVVASADSTTDREPLERVYDSAESVFVTGIDGCVTVTIEANGAWQVIPFRNGTEARTSPGAAVSARTMTGFDSGDAP